MANKSKFGNVTTCAANESRSVVRRGNNSNATEPGLERASMNDPAWRWRVLERGEGVRVGSNAMEPPPVVFVVDDDADVQRVIRELASSVGLSVETYTDARSFLAAAAPDRPGCVVMDVRLPGMSGLTLMRELVARGVQLPVIMVTGFAEVSVAVEAMKTGVFDFIEKPYRNQRLLDSIQRAMERDHSERRARRRGEELQQRVAQLTEREREVLHLVVSGMTSEVIAAELGIQEKTVQVYRSHINKKMGVHNAVELARVFYNIGS